MIAYACFNELSSILKICCSEKLIFHDRIENEDSNKSI